MSGDSCGEINLYDKFRSRMENRQLYQRVTNYLVSNFNMGVLRSVIEVEAVKHDDIEVRFRDGMFQAIVGDKEEQICIPFCPMIPCRFHPVRGNVTCDHHYADYELYWKGLHTKAIQRSSSGIPVLTKTRNGDLVMVKDRQSSNESEVNNRQKRARKTKPHPATNNVTNPIPTVYGNSSSVVKATTTEIDASKTILQSRYTSRRSTTEDTIDSSLAKPVPSRKEINRKRPVGLEKGEVGKKKSKQEKHREEYLIIGQTKGVAQTSMVDSTVEVVNLSDSDNSQTAVSPFQHFTLPTTSPSIRQEEKTTIRNEPTNSDGREDSCSIEILASAISSEGVSDNSELQTGAKEDNMLELHKQLLSRLNART